MRTGVLIASLALACVALEAGCKSRTPEPASAPEPEARPSLPPPKPAQQEKGDAPLPAPDELPSFLVRDPAKPVLAADATGFSGRPEEYGRIDAAVTEEGHARPDAVRPEPSLSDLMAKVRVILPGEEEEGSFASVVDGDDGQPAAALPRPREPAAPSRNESEAELPDDEALDPDIEAAPAPDDACAPLRDALVRRQEYLRRVAAERDTFGYVENAEDASALRLLQGLRRCADHPDDEDCRQKPIEVDVRDLEPPRHQYERWPSELEAEKKAPDEVPHDPQILELLHELRQCERKLSAQPLLE
ncbi:hypothetical protein [Vulgatibacter incomptus]|uniref:Uncharacterized protein n=1 Tax=Vulgatibacter incomptus TaxID=1391653 RepID=A0A0K1PA15_9BACT|nr:hypothetical protein [Vulgatibacter incomptus]AKU89959.1 hypothetical protein AKJ08_0346 [Vulgatibacter incomptus]